ncbi:MAG TPA: hypothetical protein VLQ45_09550 [Thermoanaerobaculia bacterium]|nr:hypothetical protein [Thermoanaerobaculia bacterium]
MPKSQTSSNDRERRWRRGAAVGLLGAALLTLAGIGAGQAAAGSLEKRLEKREAQYLEYGLAHIRRMEGNFGSLGKQPLGAGALAAAALAAEGRPDAPARREEAARWVTRILEICGGKWGDEECARTQIPLQKLALQVPQVLPEELRARLREQVSAAAPPPDASQIRNPWSFPETENQRVIRMARSLVAHTVAGTPDSPGARAWGAYAKAFLEAHERDGWYEAESPGYMALSLGGVLHLADHAPQKEVRDLAERQLHLLFAGWAQEQVGGYPAGPKSRTNGNWALSDRSTPWVSWAWLATGKGNPEGMNFMDRPELAVSRYEMPAAVVKLLAERNRQKSYEIEERRTVSTGKRKQVNTALYSYATPDYILGAVQSVSDLDLRVSGGQEIVVTLYAEGPEFSPLYLWSRTQNDKKARWKEWGGQDKAVAEKNVALARVGGQGADLGHAYLAAPWSRPEIAGQALVSRSGDTYVALVTDGGWEVAPATERFPGYYAGTKLQARRLAGSWVAVPKKQPASIALEVGRAAEDGDFAAWTKKAAGLRLRVEEELRFKATDGQEMSFLPGRRATAAGKVLEAERYPPLAGPFLASGERGRWTFAFESFRLRVDPLGGRPPT